MVVVVVVVSTVVVVVVSTVVDVEATSAPVVVGLSMTAVTTSVGGRPRVTSTRRRADDRPASPYRPTFNR